VFIWYRFLWKVSRIPLRLNALHPDRAGGLGFLDVTPFALLPVLIAQTALLAGEIGDRIWHAGMKLPQFKLDVIVVISFSVLLAYIPLTFFVVRLYTARWVARRDYGTFATRYVRDFREKWIDRPADEHSETPLGSGDIQSLADLGNSFEVVRNTGVVPFATKSALRLAIVLALPLAPLLFTMIPVNDMIDRLIKLVL
jgi:hypothetical protein